MSPPSDNRRRLPAPGITVAIVLVGAVVLAGLILAVTGMSDSGNGTAAGPGRQPVQDQLRAPQAKATGPEGDPIAVITKKTALRASPDGRKIGALDTKTEFKSSKVVAVVDRKGDWLRVIASDLQNGKRGWIDARDTEAGITQFRIRADLSARRIDIVKDGKVVRRIRSAVGEQGTPTPRGKFAITDKVPFTDRGSPYGCCALALSAHQPNTPSEWSGGDRVAIHATPAARSIGQPVTLGCMRVPAADARWMMRTIPLGTQVTIKA